MQREFKGIWIPKELWLLKDLSLVEKVMLVEIDSLDNEDGCYATNEYFSGFFNLSKGRISKIINNLVKKGYITSELKYQQDTKLAGKRVLKNSCLYRRITSSQKQPDGMIENDYGHSQKQLRGMVENDQENNIYNNIISSSKILKDEISQQNKEEIIQEKEIKTKTKLTCCSSKEKTIFDQKAKQKRKYFSADSIPYLLAKHLERCIQIHSPEFPSKEAQRQRWAKDIDLMLRIDKLDPDDVARTIQWCQQDSFWKSNILSGKKLREKYQQLRIKMEV